MLSELLKDSKRILIVTGIWPKRVPTVFDRFRSSLNLFLITTLVICMYYNAIYKSHDFIDFSKNIYVTLVVWILVIKSYVFVFNRKKIFQLLDLLELKSFTRFLNIYEDEYNYYLKLYKIIWVGCKAQVTVYLTAQTVHPVLEHKPLPVEFPHFNNGIYHYPFYIYQVVSLWTAAFQVIALDMLFMLGVVSNAALQLKILSRKLVDTHKNVVTQENREEHIYQYLRECCMHYSDIEEFLKLTNLFSLAYFAQMISDAMAICVSGFVLLSVGKYSAEAISLYFFLFSVLTQLGLACFFGDEVLAKSEEVFLSCYMSNWEEMGPRNRKALFMLMERSKRSLEVQGLGYITLSYNTFITILKWSYSYFTLLQTITLKEE